MLRRAKTYTFQELEAERHIQEIERKLADIKKNKKLWKSLVVFVAIFLLTTNSSFALGAGGAKGIAAIGTKVYDIIVDFAGWYAIIGCAIDLIRCGFNGTTNNFGKIIMNYLMIYASIAMLPWLINTIKGVLL